MVNYYLECIGLIIRSWVIKVFNIVRHPHSGVPHPQIWSHMVCTSAVSCIGQAVNLHLLLSLLSITDLEH